MYVHKIKAFLLIAMIIASAAVTSFDVAEARSSFGGRSSFSSRSFSSRSYSRPSFSSWRPRSAPRTIIRQRTVHHHYNNNQGGGFGNGGGGMGIGSHIAGTAAGVVVGNALTHGLSGGGHGGGHTTVVQPGYSQGYAQPSSYPPPQDAGYAQPQDPQYQQDPGYAQNVAPTPIADVQPAEHKGKEQVNWFLFPFQVFWNTLSFLATLLFSVLGFALALGIIGGLGWLAVRFVRNNKHRLLK